MTVPIQDCRRSRLRWPGLFRDSISPRLMPLHWTSRSLALRGWISPGWPPSVHRLACLLPVVWPAVLHWYQERAARSHSAGGRRWHFRCPEARRSAPAYLRQVPPIPLRVFLQRTAPGQLPFSWLHSRRMAGKTRPRNIQDSSKIAVGLKEKSRRITFGYVIRRLLGGAEGTRTPDPLHAMQVRYQLRHSPKLFPSESLHFPEATRPA
jgi:hypothetical protein